MTMVHLKLKINKELEKAIFESKTKEYEIQIGFRKIVVRPIFSKYFSVKKFFFFLYLFTHLYLSVIINMIYRTQRKPNMLKKLQIKITFISQAFIIFVVIHLVQYYFSTQLLINLMRYLGCQVNFIKMILYT